MTRRSLFKVVFGGFATALVPKPVIKSQHWDYIIADDPVDALFNWQWICKPRYHFKSYSVGFFMKKGKELCLDEVASELRRHKGRVEMSRLRQMVPGGSEQASSQVPILQEGDSESGKEMS